MLIEESPISVNKIFMSSKILSLMENLLPLYLLSKHLKLLMVKELLKKAKNTFLKLTIINNCLLNFFIVRLSPEILWLIYQNKSLVLLNCMIISLFLINKDVIISFMPANYLTLNSNKKESLKKNLYR